MAQEEEIIRIDLDLESATKKSADLEREIIATTKAIKDLQKATKGNIGAQKAAAGTMVKLKNELKATKDEQREINKTITDNSKAARQNSNTIEGMRTRVSQLNAQWKKTEIGSEQFKALEKELKKTTDELKDFEKAAGDNRRSVVYYSEALQAIPIRELQAGLTAAKASFEILSKGIIVAKSSFITLNGALKGSFFGAFIVILTGLVNYFKRTKEGSQQLEAAMAALSAVGEKILDNFALIGKALITAFSTPQETITQLGTVLKSQITDRFTALLDTLGLVGTAVKKFFEGDFTGAMYAAKEAGAKFTTDVIPVKDIKDGFNSARESVSEFIDTTIKSTAEAGKAAFANEQAFQRLRDAERALKEDTAARALEIAKLRLISRDVTKTDEERLEASRKANALQEESIRKEAALAQQRVKLLEQQKDITNSLEADEQEVSDARVAAFNIEAQLIKEKESLATEQAALEMAIQKKNEAEQKATRDAEIKGKFDKIALLKELSEGNFQYQKELLEREKNLKLDNDNLTNEERLQIELDYLAKKSEIEGLNFEEQLEIEKERQQIINENDALTREEKEIAIAESEKRITDILAEQEAQRVTNLEAQKQKEDSIRTAKLKLATDATNAVIDLFGKESAAGQAALLVQKGIFLAEKAFALNSAIINTANAVVGALNTPPYPPFTIPAAIQAGVTGGIQIAKIAATTIAGFKDGGNIAFEGGNIPKSGGMITGRTHATGGVKFNMGARIGEAQRGEAYIVNISGRQDLKEAASAINVAGGGKAFAHGGVVKYQDGGVSSTFGSGIIQANEQQNIIAESLQNFRPVVAVEDIRTVDEEFTEVLQRANL